MFMKGWKNCHAQEPLHLFRLFDSNLELDISVITIIQNYMKV